MPNATRTILCAAICTVGLGLSLSAASVGRQTPASASAGGTMPVAAQNALVKRYCVACHNDAQMVGGLSLEKFDAAHPKANVIGMMLVKLRAKAMPPPGMPRPDAGTYAAFTRALEVEGGDKTAPSDWPSPMPKAVGAPKVIAVAHNGDVMSVPAQNKMVHTICIQCHTDARKPGGVSFEHLDMKAVPTQHRELAEKMIAKLRAGMMPPQTAPKRPDQASIQAFIVSLERRIDKAAAAHLNPGGRLFQRLNRVEYANSIQTMLGLDVDVSQWLPPDTVSHNFADIAAVQDVSPTLLQGYLDAASEISRLAVGDRHAAPSSVAYRADSDSSQTGHVAGAPLGTRGGLSVIHMFPADGTYRFKLLFFRTLSGRLFGLTAAHEQIEVSIDDRRVALLDVDPRMSEAEPHGLTLETPPIQMKAGPQRVSAAFVEQAEGPVDDLVVPQAYTLADLDIGDASSAGLTVLPHLRTLTISGPFHITGVSETVSRDRIFICRPLTAADETPCARRIMANLAGQAYRRPATADELSGLMKFYAQGRARGGFEPGIRLALQALLSSPHFIFRLERRPETVSASGDYRIGDFALASRLSYFLWGQPPDATLLKLAEKGRLHVKSVLDAQVHRMLKDLRSFALSARFVYHWLRLQDVSKVRPDALMYPMYGGRLQHDMIEETELFFNSIVTQDRNVLDLLTGDYTFVNQDLAAYYGIPGVAGPRFQKVSLKGTHRRGLLGEGSIQVETSVATRSDPVLRGKWILEVMLGQPPPPPPPGVNTNLDQTSKAVQNGEPLTVRQRMEEHRKNPVCASCHNTIDPLGLALEHFGPAGHYRIKDNGVPVNADTVMYDGTHMDGLDGLITGLMKHKGTFLRVFTENLMAYALGRQIQYFDMSTVRSVIHQASLNGNRFSSYVLGIVNSDAFLMNGEGGLTADGSRPSQSKKRR